MKIAIYSSKSYDKEYLSLSNKNLKHNLLFLNDRLDSNTVHLSKGCRVICVFTNDILDKEVIKLLSSQNVELIALRCAGYDNIDLKAAEHYDIKVSRVSNYSPNAVAEHALCLMLALNRHIYQSYSQVKESNFSIDNLLGFNFKGKTIGIIGTGKIGSVLAHITKAMGMKVIAYDVKKNKNNLDIEYVDINHLFSNSDVISLHCPLNDDTQHLINSKVLSIMKNDVMLINTSRGAVVDTCAVIKALENNKIGYFGMDVYENEKGVFFKDLSCDNYSEKLLTKLASFPNVLISSHQGFFTKEALINIANTTLQNVNYFEKNKDIPTKDLLN